MRGRKRRERWAPGDCCLPGSGEGRGANSTRTWRESENAPLRLGRMKEPRSRGRGDHREAGCPPGGCRQGQKVGAVGERELPGSRASENERSSPAHAPPDLVGLVTPGCER